MEELEKILNPRKGKVKRGMFMNKAKENNDSDAKMIN